MERKRRRDCISALPDDLLIGILTLLPMKEAIRTSVLSPRWKNLWKRIPRLNFVEDEWRKSKHKSAPKSIVCVDRVLRWHEARALEEFKVCFCLNDENGPHIDDWLQFLLAKKVPRLHFDLHGRHVLNDHYCLDWFYYDESYALRDDIIRRSCGVKGFDFLTSLSLKRVKVTSEVITFLLQNAPFLEQLAVHGSQLIYKLEVCGCNIKLKHLEVCDCPELDVLRISAPELTSLKVSKF